MTALALLALTIAVLYVGVRVVEGLAELLAWAFAALGVAAFATARWLFRRKK